MTGPMIDKPDLQDLIRDALDRVHEISISLDDYAASAAKAVEAHLASGSFYQEKDIDAMQAEIARLTAERDAAFRAGAEAMRTEVDGIVIRYYGPGGFSHIGKLPKEVRQIIRALPLPEETQDDVL